MFRSVYMYKNWGCSYAARNRSRKSLCCWLMKYLCQILLDRLLWIITSKPRLTFSHRKGPRSSWGIICLRVGGANGHNYTCQWGTMVGSEDHIIKDRHGSHWWCILINIAYVLVFLLIQNDVKHYDWVIRRADSCKFCPSPFGFNTCWGKITFFLLGCGLLFHLSILVWPHT